MQLYIPKSIKSSGIGDQKIAMVCKMIMSASVIASCGVERVIVFYLFI